MSYFKDKNDGSIRIKITLEEYKTFDKFTHTVYVDENGQNPTVILRSQKEIEEQTRKSLLKQLTDEEEQFNEGFNRAHDFDYEETIKAFNKVGHLNG